MKTSPTSWKWRKQKNLWEDLIINSMEMVDLSEDLMEIQSPWTLRQADPKIL